jgi:hypothetical protein
MIGGGGSPARIRLWHQFPANREKNREFYETRDFGGKFISENARAAGLSAQFPYATEQGIVFTEQGTLAQEQGTSGKRPFFAHLFCGWRTRSVLALKFADEESEMAGENRPRQCYDEAFWRAHHEAWQRSDLNQRGYWVLRGSGHPAQGVWQLESQVQSRAAAS